MIVEKALNALGCVSIFFGANAVAQTVPGDVTFEVPVDLTRLSAQISKIAVECAAADGPITQSGAGSHGRMVNGRRELGVADGQVSSTAHVTVPASSAGWKIGMTIYFECKLLGFNKQNNVWRAFSQKESKYDENSVFFVTSTPAPITGTFVW